MPMFVIDDRDEQGQLGLSVFIARNEQQAIREFTKRNPTWTIEEIEECEWLELAEMVDDRGATSYRRRKP